MRVFSMTELPIVIRVETPREVVVALPRIESSEEILKLASLVLSGKEFDELRNTLHSSRLPHGRGRRIPRQLH